MVTLFFMKSWILIKQDCRGITAFIPYFFSLVLRCFMVVSSFLIHGCQENCFSLYIYNSTIPLSSGFRKYILFYLCQFSDLENGLISLVDYILIECQAAKRQKLEGGSLHKVCKFDYSTSSCDYLITEEVTVILCLCLNAQI